MDPGTGRVYELPEGFAEGAKIGDTLSKTEIASELERLQAEILRRGMNLAEADSLTLIGDEAAQKLKLGAREQERRRKRRKTASASRRRNR